ncbi:MAG: S-layer homology domain-containing protein, partial [Microcoleaceae cyanobacterium]
PTPGPVPSPIPTPGPSPIPTPGTSPGTLNDVVGHWAEAFIRGLVNFGVVKGFPDGTFRPNNKLTRAEYAALLAGAFDVAPKRDAVKFKDVPDNFWGKSAIEIINRGGFMSGYPDGTFRPNQNLTREQTLVSLVNGLQLTGSGGTNILTVYGDRAQISSYATNGAAIATEKKLVVNYPNKDRLEPARDITRAEVSAIVYQVLVLEGRLPAINSSYIV